MSPSNGKKVGSVSPDYWVIINQPHFVSDQSPVFHCSSSKIRDSKLIRFCTIRTSEGICIIVSIILKKISRVKNISALRPEKNVSGKTYSGKSVNYFHRNIFRVFSEISSNQMFWATNSNQSICLWRISCFAFKG